MAVEMAAEGEQDRFDVVERPHPPRWAVGVAGISAGIISRFLVNPLDVLKIRFQVQLEPTAAVGRHAREAARSKYHSITGALITIVREEGLKGLWRGNLAGQLMTVPYTTAQFIALHQCKLAAKKHGYEHHPATSFLGGAVAGAAGTVASYPLDLLRTTLAAQGEPKVYSGIVDAATKIYAKRGVRGLYRGLSVTLIEIVPYSALQFGIYDALNRAWNNATGSRRSQTSDAIRPFVCGVVSGAASKLATHPLDLAKKRFQVAGLQRAAKYGRSIPESATSSLTRCLADIVRNEGVVGLYKGVGPSLLKAAPAAAITLASYELVLGYLAAAVYARESHKAGDERREP